MNKILAVVLILSVLVVSMFLVTPTVSASIGGAGCCSWDQSVWSGCMSQRYIQWKNCMGFNADVSIEAYYGFIDW